MVIGQPRKRTLAACRFDSGVTVFSNGMTFGNPLSKFMNSSSSGNSLAELVTDWGGFEKLVAELHDTGDVNVEHNVTLPGRSGAPRQIDVLVRYTQGLYEHLIVVECKYRNSPIERLHVDALATTIREVGASRGVIFSTKGFQSGAIAQAEHENISLFLLREPTDAEWGLPGRHLDIWLHYVSISIGNLEMPGTTATPLRPGVSPRIDIRLGDPAGPSQTRIKVDGKPHPTLEELLLDIANRSAQLAYRPTHIDFGGTFEGTVKNVIKVNFAPETPTQIFLDGAIIFAPRITFDLGTKVTQSRLQLDRGTPYAFVLAIEDCIKKVVTKAYRGREEAVTQLHPTGDTTAELSGDPYKNGSIMSIWLKGFENFDEFSGVTPSSGSEVLLKLVL